MEHLIDLLQNHEYEPVSGTQTSNPHVISRNGDLNVPITLRKRTQSRTQHLISNFIAYSHLSSFVQTFVTNLVVVEVLKPIQEALSIQDGEM